LRRYSTYVLPTLKNCQGLYKCCASHLVEHKLSLCLFSVDDNNISISGWCKRFFNNYFLHFLGKYLIQKYLKTEILQTTKLCRSPHIVLQLLPRKYYSQAVIRWVFRDVDLSFPMGWQNFNFVTHRRPLDLSENGNPKGRFEISMPSPHPSLMNSDRFRWVKLAELRAVDISSTRRFGEILKNFRLLYLFFFRALGTYRIFLQKWRFEHVYLRLWSLHRSDELNILFSF